MRVMKKADSKIGFYFFQGFILLLICLVVRGAFLGSERVSGFFDGISAVFFPAILVLVIGGGFIFYRYLRMGPGGVVMLVGGVLIVCGFVWGLPVGHKFRQRHSGGHEIMEGRMVVYEGAAESRVQTSEGRMCLPFEVRLNDFRVEYYEPDLPGGERKVKDYLSDIEILQDGESVLRRMLEVNKPIHFGGFHFYQDGYDASAGEYVVLKVVSDAGLGGMYLGFLLLCAGAVWCFWFSGLLKEGGIGNGN